MRIGLITQLHGAPGGSQPAIGWQQLKEVATTAEAVGFDSLVFEDALMYRQADETFGVWESVSIAGALAAATSVISIGQSVVNAPYRSPAMMAKIAETLDEVSSGRYLFGIGAGNTPDSDYEAFGFPTDRRYSRFEEAIEIIHVLLKTGAVDFMGSYHSAREAELVLRGPRPGGPPIIVAAGGPKMLRLAARYADEWNWWTADHRTAEDDLRPIVDELERACEDMGRDPREMRRSLDFYSIAAPGREQGEDQDYVFTGSDVEIAERILSFGELGFGEVRCDLASKSKEDIEAMAEVVRMVHEA